jgi:non-ribosomal peptide synthetase component F
MVRKASARPEAASSSVSSNPESEVHRLEERDVANRRVALWREVLAGAPAALELPIDRPRSAVKQGSIGEVDVEVPRGMAEGVRALCRGESVGPSIVLLATFQSVLSRWSGQADVVVGAPLPIRATFDDDSTFVAMLRQVQRSQSFAETNREVPFEKIVEALDIAADGSRAALFQAAFGWKARGALDVSRFDLALFFDEDGDAFRVSLEYDVALFDRSTIERFASHFVTFLEAAARRPTERIARYPLMAEEERRQIAEWSVGLQDEPRNVCVHELFEEQAQSTPDAVAVTDEQDISLSSRCRVIPWRSGRTRA